MTFGLKDCRYCGEGRFDLGDYPTSARIDKSRREEYEQLQENHRKLQEEHELLKATFEESVVDAEYRLLMLEAAQEPIV